MKKRGQAPTGAVIVLGLVVFFILLSWLVPKISNAAEPFFLLFGIGEEEKDKETIPLSPAEKAFESFLMSYEDCKKYKSDDCLCDEFDVTIIPNGNSIKLENLDKKGTRIELYSDKPTADKPKVIENDNLCFYVYDKSTKKFSKTDANEIVLDPQTGDGLYKVHNKIQLFRFDKENTCFVSGTYESKVFDEIIKSKLKCNLKDAGEGSARMGMLDSSDYTGDYSEYSAKNRDDETSNIIDYLRIFLSNNVGRVTRITNYIGGDWGKQTRLERRENMFNDVYKNFDKNEDGFIKDDVYFISIRSLQVNKEQSSIKRDYFKIHYLKGSEQGKALAEKIKLRLAELNGKTIADSVGDKKISVAEAGKSYQFNFQIETEENSKEKVGPVFLACKDDYENFIADLGGRPCKESTSIPAVFIDIVEVYEKENNHDIFEGHSRAIAEKIYEGVKDYLPLYESIAAKEEEIKLEKMRELIEQGKNEILLFKRQYSNLLNRFSESELKTYEDPCILGVFTDIKLSEGYQIEINTPGSFDSNKHTSTESVYRAYYATDEKVSIYLYQEEIEDRDFILSKSQKEYNVIQSPKIIIKKDGFLVYDMDKNQIAEGDFKKGGTLVIARYNGKNYWSNDYTKDYLKPTCYPSIKQG